MTKHIVLSIALLFTLSAHAGEFDYNRGFEDGCQSGKNDWLHPFKKDIESFVKDEYYKAGWNDGHAKCAADYKIINDAISF